jgi:hypothetical protein
MRCRRGTSAILPCRTIPEPLIGNPRYVQLLYELDDYRLFELRDRPLDIEPVTLISENFEEDPSLLTNWSLGIRPLSWWQSLTNAFTGDHAILTRDLNGGFIETRRERSYKARPEITDVLQRGDLGPNESAFITRLSDFDASLGTMQLEAEIEGDGYFEVVMTAYDRNGTQVSMEPQVLWNGVLFEGERRSIHAQFTDLSARIDPSALGDSDRLYRIFFQIRDGGYLRLYNWRINHFPEITPRSSDFTDRYLLPLNSGWSQVGDDLSGREFYFGVAATDPDPDDHFTPVRFRRYDSRAVGVSSPSWTAPVEFYESNRLEASTRLSSTIRPTVELTTSIEGNGVVDLTAVIRCYSVLEEDIVEDAGEGAAWATDDAGSIRVPLGSILLRGDTRSENLSFDVPCLPQLLNIEYQTRRNTHLVVRDVSLSDISILDLDLNLRMLDITGQVSVVPFAITTQQIEDYHSRSTAPANSN